MIRTATPDDSSFVSAVGVAAGMFPADDTSVTDQMMAAYFAGKRDEGHVCLIDELAEGAERVAMAYVEPVRATDGTWELLMIAVHPSHQSRGRGAALVRHVEQALREQGQRLLLVQTSSEASYARTRAFYVACGYEQAAQISNYYAPGVDMVLFRKDLVTSAGQ
ncbi:MAG: GNAT family N-acetyltransferase [Kofleriaceae bacterium]|nr:GNAT family N-acetyltransferase [Kofleriaceae bacterium]